MFYLPEEDEYLIATDLSLERQPMPLSPPSKYLGELPSLFETTSYRSTNTDMPPAIDDLDLQDDGVLVAYTEEYSYDAMIEEAEKYYKDTKPEFCVSNREYMSKTVVLSGSEQLTDLGFEVWSADYGFWTLTDRISDRYIVKHKGGKYYVWNGVAQGLSDEPVASVLKNGGRPKKAPSTASWAESDGEDSGQNRPLRRRTMRQSMPYTVDRTQRKYDMKGLRLSEAELEEAAWDATSSPLVRRRKKQKLDDSGSVGDGIASSSGSTRCQSSMTSVSPASFEGGPTIGATLRTRFHGFDDATVPLTTDKCPDHKTLFQSIKQKWAFKLIERKILYCVAAFPWLDTSKNILLQEADEDGYTSMMDEVRRASMSQTESRVEVTITIHVQEGEDAH